MLIVIDAVGIREGGAAAILAELLHWLPRWRPDWRWHVLLFERRLRQFDDPVVAPNVALECTPHGNRGLERILWVNVLLPRRLKQLGASLLFSFANLGALRPVVPTVIYCQQRLLLFREAHAEYPLLERWRLRVQTFFARRGARASSAVIVQTDDMRERFLQLEPGLAGKIHVLPCGSRTPSLATSIRPEKKNLIDGCGRPRLVYVSLLRHHKNHLNLVRGFAEIVRAIPSARLLLTVEEQKAPYPEVEGLLVQVHDLIRTLGLTENIVWLGQLTPDEVVYAFSQSDLMLFPSLAESFGLPLVEAMAAGCPIAAADLSYAHQVAGPAASYFPPQDPAALARCVLSLLQNPEQLRALRQAGQVRKEDYSYEKIAAQLIEIFEKAVTTQ